LILRADGLFSLTLHIQREGEEEGKKRRMKKMRWEEERTGQERKKERGKEKIRLRREKIENERLKKDVRAI
jgi:hypothetical protein